MRLVTKMLSMLIALAVPAAALAQFPQLPANVRVADRAAVPAGAAAQETVLLTEPFLQNPDEDSVRVVWFTEFPGVRHALVYGDELDALTARETLLAQAPPRIRVTFAETEKLTRTREDQRSQVPGKTYEDVTDRPIWRHQAVAVGLEPGERLPYLVASIDASGGIALSDIYTLAPKPAAGAPVQILLTSDHQSKAMAPANLELVERTLGRVDAVFFAGDLVNVPDRASEWFDDARGGAFFPGLQGTASRELTYEGQTTVWSGGEIIQHAPLYPVIGNHEVMGRVTDEGLNTQFNSPVLRDVAVTQYEKFAHQVNPTGDPDVREQWIENNSFNADTYLELFDLPESEAGGESYYATTFGNVRLVALYATRIWRSPNTSGNRNGKYVEATENLDQPLEQGYGTFIFEAIEQGTPQYQWLVEELFSDEFQSAEYKVVMFHHPMHNLGGNVVPSFTDPVRIEERDANGELVGVRYEYPKDENYLVRDLEPLFEAAGVDLVFNGHNHVWNRFESPAGVHYLESSNVGNTYGAYTEGRSERWGMPPSPPWNAENYDAVDDPYGLEPVVPNEGPILDEQGQPLPYLADNTITAFTVLDTESGFVSTWAFDTKQPESEPWLFDRFQLD